jgi:ABC-type Fe3+/spermidine/putrescine transport system ATPase subunit
MIIQGTQTLPVSPVLEVKRALKRFGSREVLREVSLTIARGEFITILGESGSGKTTLLRLIAGFEKLDGGELWMDGERLDPLPPFKRPVNTVFQQYALFPHLSVFENVAYGLRIKNLASSAIGPRVERALAMVRMDSFGARAPSTLSGGQQQRIALARAIVNEPKILLLDEPLSALDAHLRRQMQGELKALQRELGITFIFVTHDQDEAMALSDRVALLRHGKLEQVGTPQEIYRNPVTAYTAQFIGETNLQKCLVSAGVAEWGGMRWPAGGGDGSALFSIRPEKIRFATDTQNTGAIRFRATIRSQTYEGATELLEIECSKDHLLRARIASRPGLSLGAARDFEFEYADAVRVQETS